MSPCWTKVSIRVTNRQAAEEALKNMSLNPKDHILNKVLDKSFEVVGLNRQQEATFRSQYARSFSIAAAKSKYFRLSKEECLPDGTIKLYFKR